MVTLLIELSDEDVAAFIKTFNMVTTGPEMTTFEFEANLDDLTELIRQVTITEIPHVVAHVESLYMDEDDDISTDWDDDKDFDDNKRITRILN